MLVMHTLESSAVNQTADKQLINMEGEGKGKPLQPAQGKDANNPNPLPKGQSQPLQRRDGDDQNRNIRQDMHTSIGEPQRFRIKAVSPYRGVPEFSHGDAVKESTYHGPGAVGG